MIDIMETAAHRVGAGVRYIRLAETTVVLPYTDRRGGSGDRSREPTPQPGGATETHCLWSGRAFPPRQTGGSAQKFCSTGHRQAFWVAARRWTMRAIEAGLLSVDCLKASPPSVHAASAALDRYGNPVSDRGPQAYPIPGLN